MSHSSRALQRRLSDTSSSVFIQRRPMYICYHIHRRGVFLPSFCLFILFKQQNRRAYKRSSSFRVVAEHHCGVEFRPCDHQMTRFRAHELRPAPAKKPLYFAFLCSSRRCLSIAEPPTLTFIMPL